MLPSVISSKGLFIKNTLHLSSAVLIGKCLSYHLGPKPNFQYQRL